MDLKELSSLDFEEDLKPQISETKEAPLTPNNTNPQTSNVKEGVKPLQTKQTLSFKEDAKSEEKSIKNQ